MTIQKQPHISREPRKHAKNAKRLTRDTEHFAAFFRDFRVFRSSSARLFRLFLNRSLVEFCQRPYQPLVFRPFLLRRVIHSGVMPPVVLDDERKYFAIRNVLFRQYQSAAMICRCGRSKLCDSAWPLPPGSGRLRAGARMPRLNSASTVSPRPDAAAIYQGVAPFALAKSTDVAATMARTATISA